MCISHRSTLGIVPQLLFTMLSDVDSITGLDLGNRARVAPRTPRMHLSHLSYVGIRGVYYHSGL